MHEGLNRERGVVFMQRVHGIICPCVRALRFTNAVHRSSALHTLFHAVALGC